MFGPTIMNKQLDPQWWTPVYNSSWERVKAAFKRDWDQTKHDFGGKEPDTNQDVNNTVAQAVGKEPIPPRGEPTFEEAEQGYRFGYGARRHYGKRYPAWDEKLEAQLKNDWDYGGADPERSYEQYRRHIRRGWDYEEP